MKFQEDEDCYENIPVMFNRWIIDDFDCKEGFRRYQSLWYEYRKDVSIHKKGKWEGLESCFVFIFMIALCILSKSIFER